MEQEQEAIGLASIGGLSAGTRHPVNTGAPCRNCGTPVPDRFCPQCGQLAADFQRPVWDLVRASLADMFALDGRVWRTLPPLLLKPGRMTRTYINGQRTRYVPPFRLFLLASVIFFLTVFTVLERQPWMQEFRFDPSQFQSETVEFAGGAVEITDATAAEARLRAMLEDESLTPAQREQIEASLTIVERSLRFTDFLEEDGRINREALNAALDRQTEGLTAREAAAVRDNALRLANVYENQAAFGARLKEWAPRVTLLFLPVFSLLLALSYAWHRRFYLYDHLVTGLHFQTFVYVFLTLVILVASLIPALPDWGPGIVLLVLLAYLWRMLRVVYDTGWVAAGVRATVLLLAGIMVISALASGLIFMSVMLV